MAVNDQLFDGDDEDDSFQALERDDDRIVWEANKSLQREQFRLLVRRQDEIERERIADLAEADDALLGLLQQFRYDDEGFLEKLDPELYGPSDEGEEDGETDLGLMDDVDSEPDNEDDADTDHEAEEAVAEVPESVTKLPSVEFKVDVLERLAALRRSGDLTENEFESMKAELLR